MIMTSKAMIKNTMIPPRARILLHHSPKFVVCMSNSLIYLCTGTAETTFPDALCGRGFLLYHWIPANSTIPPMSWYRSTMTTSTIPRNSAELRDSVVQSDTVELQTACRHQTSIQLTNINQEILNAEFCLRGSSLLYWTFIIGYSAVCLPTSGSRKKLYLHRF